MTIQRYPSIAALVADAESHRNYREFSDDDCGYESPEITLQKAKHGDSALVPAAERMIDNLTLDLDIPERCWQPDVCGAYPVVGDFLAGNPECMRRLQPMESERSPLNIFVIITASHACSAETLMKRGTAILAMTLASSRIRQISLHIVSIGDESGYGESVITAPINATPLDIATAAYVLTSAAFFRRLAYGLASALHSTRGKWPDGYVKTRQAYVRGLIERLNGNPETDLIVDAAFKLDPLVKEPLAFVQAQIDRFTQ
jgi:hypothetical protein